jgi:hypothetical protein
MIFYTVLQITAKKEEAPMSNKIAAIMDWLVIKLAWLLEWKYFNPITGIISLINPLALAPQVYQVIFADNVSGVSWPMYVIFSAIQLVFTFVAIKSKNFGMMIAMLISLLESIAIIIIVLIRL